MRVTLPEITNREHGFHVECYWRFPVLSKSYRENLKNELETFHHPLKEKKYCYVGQTRFSPKNIQVSWTGAFQRKCIFCLQSIIILTKV